MKEKIQFYYPLQNFERYNKTKILQFQNLNLYFILCTLSNNESSQTVTLETLNFGMQ